MPAAAAAALEVFLPRERQSCSWLRGGSREGGGGQVSGGASAVASEEFRVL